MLFSQVKRGLTLGVQTVSELCVCVCVSERTKMDIRPSRALGVSSFFSHPRAVVGRTSAGPHAMLFSSSCSSLAGSR